MGKIACTPYGATAKIKQRLASLLYASRASGSCVAADANVYVRSEQRLAAAAFQTETCTHHFRCRYMWSKCSSGLVVVVVVVHVP